MVISKEKFAYLESVAKPTKWAGDLNFVKLKTFELEQMYPNKDFTFAKLGPNMFHVYEYKEPKPNVTNPDFRSQGFGRAKPYPDWDDMEKGNW